MSMPVFHRSEETSRIYTCTHIRLERRAMHADVTALYSPHTAAAEKGITVSVNIAVRVWKKRNTSCR